MTTEEKNKLTTEIKSYVQSALKRSDWYITRKAERDIAIPQSITDERTAILAAYDTYEAGIDAKSTYQEGYGFMTGIVINNEPLHFEFLAKKNPMVYPQERII
tara:strand:+ start:1194 stop:1502 length:309 start_codon:yes stop_codon:yes gene_type:complete